MESLQACIAEMTKVNKDMAAAMEVLDATVLEHKKKAAPARQPESVRTAWTPPTPPPASRAADPRMDRQPVFAAASPQGRTNMPWTQWPAGQYQEDLSGQRMWNSPHHVPETLSLAAVRRQSASRPASGAPARRSISSPVRVPDLSAQSPQHMLPICDMMGNNGSRTRVQDQFAANLPNTNQHSWLNQQR